MMNLSPLRQLRLSGRLKIVLATALGLILLVAGVGAAVLGYYSGRILPGVVIAGIKVGGLTPAEASSRLEAAGESYQISFQAGEQTITPKPEELGITLDLRASVEQAYWLGHRGSLISWVGDWWSLGRREVREREISHRFDEQKLDAYVAGVVQTTSKAPVNAHLAVSGEQVQIVPEVAGQQTGVEDAGALIKASLRTFGSTRLVVGLKSLDPAIHAADLTGAKAEAEAILAQPVTLSYNGVTYTPSRVQRAGWLAFTEDTAAKTNKVTVDSGAVSRYLQANVTKKIAYAAIPKIIQKNVDSGEESVAQEGRDGLSVDEARLMREIVSAVGAKKAYSSVVPTSLVAFSTQQRTIYDRWIGIDLSEQRLTAYQRSEVVASYLISSGTYLYPTPVGTYHIYAKTRSQTMSGGSRLAGSYYSLPNVEWISWFYGDYGIHGTYWHNNFGHPMSHGCINMRNSEAQFVYEWAPVGTPVVVQA